MEKAVIYARFSTNKQKEISVEGQIRVCLEYAERNNIKVIGEYIDRAMTGKVDKRPEFQRMVKDSSKKLFTYVLVYQFDRFARDIYDNIGNERKLKQNGVKVVSAMEHVEDTASGRFMRNVLLSHNQYYSEELAQKVKRGMYDTFLKGYSSGGVTYGYDKIKVDPSNENSKTKKYVVNDKEAETIREIFAQYVSGKKIVEIKDWLDENHIYKRKDKPFLKSSLSTILQNKMYIGTLTFGEHERQNAVPQIVEPSIFQAVQMRISKNKHKPSIHKAKEFYLLSLKTFCGHCKQTIVGDSGKNRFGTIYRYYTCLNRKRKNRTCHKKQVNKQWLEDIVVNLTMQEILTDKMIIWAVAQLLAYNNKVMENSKLDNMEKELKLINHELGNLINAIAQGLGIGTIKDKVLELENKKADLQQEIDEEKLILPIPLVYDELLFWFESFKNGNTNCEKFRERLIDTFVNKVILSDNQIIIVYNIKGDNNEKITTQEIIDEFSNSDNSVASSLLTSPSSSISVFGYDCLGDPFRIRT